MLCWQRRCPQEGRSRSPILEELSEQLAGLDVLCCKDLRITLGHDGLLSLEGEAVFLLGQPILVITAYVAKNEVSRLKGKRSIL